MPAIEPGWVESLAGAAAFINTRTPFAQPSPFHRRVHTVLPAFTFTRRRVRVHARVRAGTTPSRQHAPQHARTPTRKTRLDLWFLFLRRASRMRSCQPRRHDLAVAGCFAHAVAGEGAPSSWSLSACLATGLSFLARVCADCGLLAHRHPWRRLELRCGSRRVAPFRPTPSLRRVVLPTRARTQAHALTRAFTCLLTGKGTRTTCGVPPPRRRRRAHTGVNLAATTTTL
jgi:hypothetical protein